LPPVAEEPLAAAIRPRHTASVRSLAVLVAAATLAGAAAASSAPPTLRIVQTKPLVVAGTHFIPGERVTVTAWTFPRVVRKTVARNGDFRLPLGNARFSRCAGVRIEAVGTEGSKALLRLPRALCVPLPSPSSGQP